MLSGLHEVLVDVFRRRPELLLELLPGGRQAPVPAHDRTRTDDPDAVAILPVPWRADLLVVFEQAGAATLAVILEVQLARDDNKRRSWPNYVTAAAARYDCDVWLMVLAPDDAVARWAARPIRTGHPGFDLLPMVLARAAIPRLVDPEQARRIPELALISAIAHGSEDNGLAVALPALQAAAELEPDRALA
ncbi:MAG: hypothetical protein HYV63_11535 [Candidatus Schekmanbacteria bacterium]|nr:hypothetical protein [Candidatus Schekmanbacteria bacterium]